MSNATAGAAAGSVGLLRVDDVVVGDCLVERDGALHEVATVAREAGGVWLSFRRTGIVAVRPLFVGTGRLVRVQRGSSLPASACLCFAPARVAAFPCDRCERCGLSISEAA